jgi:hypothetical protein
VVAPGCLSLTGAATAAGLGAVYASPTAAARLPADRSRHRRAAMGLAGLLSGMRSHERVAILLAVLGRVELPERDVGKTVRCRKRRFKACRV